MTRDKIRVTRDELRVAPGLVSLTWQLLLGLCKALQMTILGGFCKALVVEDRGHQVWLGEA
ncbi:MAG: hypothetical protein DRH11_16670 [Deltaproteobacteria bacterium]|nr:MAG: hypothetical protein DRH11_16670 [Deltaproteobacteria bacterium]